MTVVALIDAIPTDAPDAEPERIASRDVDTLICEHLPLVGHNVRAVLNRVPAYVHRDELVSAGMLALVLAAQSFNDTLGVPFPAFATIRIRGALTDALRSMDWATRSVRSKARQVHAISDQLAATLRRTPTQHEIAEAMGVAAADLHAVEADVQRGSVVSLQAVMSDTVEDSLPAQADSPEALLVKREEIGLLHDAIAELPARLRTVVEQYFFAQRKMADIAAELGVTESRISQMRAEALSLLRAALNSMDSEDPTPPHPRQLTAPRQATYVRAVATRSTLADRLKPTTLLGEPRQLVAIS